MKRYRLASLAVALVAGLLARPAQADPIVGVGAAQTDAGGNILPGTGTFGTVDLATDVYTPRGTVPSGDVLAGLGSTPSGVGYGTGFLPLVSPATVYAVNPTTGALSVNGFATLSSAGSTVGPDGLVYAIDKVNNQLYKYDPTTHITTNIGAPLSFFSDGLMAFGPNGKLYTSNGSIGVNNDPLELIDPTTGVATQIGSGAGAALFAGTFVNGTLYGFSYNGGNPEVVTIDPTTGAALHFSGPITGLPQGPGGAAITAAAFPAPTGFGPAAVPEPSTLACFVTGVLLAGAARLRRWRKARG